MSVPLENILCRFVPGNREKWSQENQRPRPRAFKENHGLSVWDVNLLKEQGVEISDLLIGSLKGHGQVHHSVKTYFEVAHVAEQALGVRMIIAVERRSEEQYVMEGWRQWAYAHVQVEYSGDPMASTEAQESVCVYFRQQMTMNASLTIPPEKS